MKQTAAANEVSCNFRYKQQKTNIEIKYFNDLTRKRNRGYFLRKFRNE